MSFWVASRRKIELQVYRAVWPFECLIWVNICTFPLTSPPSIADLSRLEREIIPNVYQLPVQSKRFASSCNWCNLNEQRKISHGNIKLLLGRAEVINRVVGKWYCSRESLKRKTGIIRRLSIYLPLTNKQRTRTISFHGAFLRAVALARGHSNVSTRT